MKVGTQTKWFSVNDSIMPLLDHVTYRQYILWQHAVFIWTQRSLSNTYAELVEPITNVSVCYSIRNRARCKFSRNVSEYFHLKTLRPRQNNPHFPNDIFKRIFLMKMYEFWLKFHWRLYSWSNFSICSDDGLAPARRHAIIWNNDV